MYIFFFGLPLCFVAQFDDDVFIDTGLDDDLGWVGFIGKSVWARVSTISVKFFCLCVEAYEKI